MSDLDTLDTSDPEARERDLFSRLPALIAAAKERAPGWAAHLDGVDPSAVTSREELARLPLLQKSNLPAMQAEAAPFGGLATKPAGAMKRLLLSPGPIAEPQEHLPDPWGAARAMRAAGFAEGDVVLNTFSYHLTPGGFIMDEGAQALGCAVIPAGPGNTEQQVVAITRFQPSAYIGTPDFLNILLDALAKAGVENPIRRAFVSGAALPPSLRDTLAQRGVNVFQCYALAEAGVVAYESEPREGLIVNEDRLIEIVRPGTGDPVADGEVGEVVVTTFSPAYPMFRLATGDLSAILPGPSPCGRTAPRIKGWMGRADQTTKVKGMFVHPSAVAELCRRHPKILRARLVVGRASEQDTMVLRAECAAPAAALAGEVAATLQALTKLRGTVELVAPGSLPNDGKVIADERPAN